MQTQPPVQTEQQPTQQHQAPRPRPSQETQRSLQTPRPQIPKQSESPQPPKQSPTSTTRDGLTSEEQRMMGLVRKNAHRVKQRWKFEDANHLKFILLGHYTLIADREENIPCFPE